MKPIYIFMASTLLAVGCKKSENDGMKFAKHPTQNGANKVSCKVNGVWHHYGGKGTLAHDDGVYFQKIGPKGTGRTEIIADESDYQEFINLTVNTDNAEIDKVYVLSTADGNQGYFVKNGNVQMTKLNTGYVKFSRFDDNIAAGEFSFTCFSTSDSAVSTVVTEGVFDISR